MEASFFVFFSCFAVFCSSYCTAPRCRRNETFVGCTSGCSPINCPVSYEEEQKWLADCVAPAVCGPAGCRCLRNYRRGPNGKCIYIGDCPGICPKNEEFTKCIQAMYRPQNCTQSGQSITFSKFPKGSCEAGCVCKRGTLRDKNGNCVPKEKCQAPQPPQCRQDEILSCVNECPPERTCENRFIQFRCAEPNKKCEQKCICKPGLFRNAIGECITGEECDLCKEDNEFFSCGSACDNVCSDGTQNRTTCSIINIVCNRKCYCKDGFARDDSNKCVLVENCPRSCKGPNEKYVDCKQTCPSEQCISLTSRKDCSNEPPCRPGCACKSGFLRDGQFSPCMPICDCPQLSNSPDCPKKEE